MSHLLGSFLSGLVRAAACAGVLCAVAGAAHAQDSQSQPASSPAAPGPANLQSPPHWSEFPAPPQNVPTPAEIRLKVNVMEGKSRQLAANASTIVWDHYAPDQLAGQFHSLIDDRYLVPIEPELTPAQVDAYAASLRARAVPPPVAQ